MDTLTKFLLGQLSIWLVAVSVGSPVSAQVSTPEFSTPLKRLRITSPYGFRKHPITGVNAFHRGVDFSAKADTVYAVFAGKVESTGHHWALGRYVRLRHGNLKTIYGHLSAVAVKKGQRVRAGQPLAITGSTGRSTAEHLHFSVELNGRTINPIILLERLSKGNNGNKKPRIIRYPTVTPDTSTVPE